MEPQRDFVARTGRFRISSKRVFLTYPRHQASPEALKDFVLQKIPSPAYILAAREQHVDGAWHLHAYAESAQIMDIKNPHFFDFMGQHGNYQSAKGNLAQVQRYLTKEGLTHVVEWRSEAWTRPRSVQATAERNKELLTTSPAEWIERGLITIGQYQRVRNSVSQFQVDMSPVSEYAPKECLWLWGPPGVGKSRTARALLPNAYWKAVSQWWDGYSGQDEVILDDLDRSANFSTLHLLKIWTDGYTFRGEVKGGHVNCVYTKLIVTSNYLPEELCALDERLAQALYRRFNVEQVIGFKQMRPVERPFRGIH